MTGCVVDTKLLNVGIGCESCTGDVSIDLSMMDGWVIVVEIVGSKIRLLSIVVVGD